MSSQKCANAENLKCLTWTAAAAFANAIFFFFSFLNEMNEMQHPSDITGCNSRLVFFGSLIPFHVFIYF